MEHRKVDALIEIPLGSRNKYELDKATGRIRLDRVLYAAMIYPAEYGILENTLAPDGDALDILVICSDPAHLFESGLHWDKLQPFVVRYLI